jgi:hypothetical protein
LKTLDFLPLSVPSWEPGSPRCVNAPHDALIVLRGLAMIVGALVTFLVVILILYLINLLPLDGRAKQIARVVVIILGIISLLKYIAVF